MSEQNDEETDHLDPSAFESGETLPLDSPGPIPSANRANDSSEPTVPLVQFTPMGLEEARQLLTDASENDKYERLEEIGRGGMGRILRAKDRDIRREVALKIMRGGDKASAARFVEEAQVTGQLEHPNIIPVHELGIDSDGKIFFAMKLIKGRSLSQILDRLKSGDKRAVRTWSLGRLLSTFVNVLNAVEFAHARGVVHRDLKPANVMTGDYGEVMVTDWGLAKVYCARESSGINPAGGQREVDRELTKLVESYRNLESIDQTLDGSIVGTPSYMAPEQAASNLQEVDERSDIYSLGAILYEILTLHPPIEGENLKAVLKRVIAGDIPPPVERAPDREIPSELAAIAMKALALRKEDRYQTIGDLRQDIDLFMTDRAVSAKEDTAWETLVKLVKRNRGASVATGIAILVLALVMTVALAINIRQRQRAESAVLKFKQAEAQRKKAEDKEKKLQAQVEEETRRDWREVFHERFQDDRVFRRWYVTAGWDNTIPMSREKASHHLEFTDKGMHMQGDGSILHITYGRPVSGDLRLSYRATWLGGDDGGFHSILRGTRWNRGYVFQIGGFGNTKAAILRGSDGLAKSLAECSFVLEAGRTYQVDVFAIRDGDQYRLQLQIDGNVLLEAIDPDPLVTGHETNRVAFMCNFNAKSQLEWATLYTLGEPKRADLLETARRHLEKGNYITARDLYREVADSTRSKEREDAAREGFHIAGSLIKSRMHLPAWRKKLEQVWPGAQVRLSLTPEGPTLTLKGTQVKSLEPLRGIPLTRLELEQVQLSDLSPLTGMKLRFLSCPTSQIRDLSPLIGMPLQQLTLRNNGPLQDLSPLHKMPLTFLDISNCYQIKDLTPLTDCPLKTLLINGCTLIENLKALEGTSLEQLNLAGLTRITDFSPLTKLPLVKLNLSGCDQIENIDFLKGLPLQELLLAECLRIGDLSPLKGMPLTLLNLTYNRTVSDLSPLAGMPIKELFLRNCSKIEDISPLAGMPLQALDLGNCHKIRDLTPLRNSQLVTLVLDGCKDITDLSALKDLPISILSLKLCSALRDLSALEHMPLNSLDLSHNPQITALPNLAGARLNTLDLTNTGISDLTPLTKLPLQRLALRHCEQIRDLSPLANSSINWLALAHCDQINDFSCLSTLPLETLYLMHSPNFTDLTILKPCPLRELYLDGNPTIADLSPLRGKTLSTLSILWCPRIQDLRLLKEMPLKELRFEPRNVTQGMQELREHPTLEVLCTTKIRKKERPLFWQEYDKPSRGNKPPSRRALEKAISPSSLPEE